MKYDVKLDLVLDLTVRQVERLDYEVLGKGGLRNVKENIVLYASAVYMWRKIRFLRYTPEGQNITISKLLEAAKEVRDHFLHIHRVNYCTFYMLRDFFDWLEDKGRASHNVVKYWRKIDSAFTSYQKYHFSGMEQKLRSLVEDHMRLARDVISEPVERLEPVVRDWFIAHRSDFVVKGQVDDIGLLSKVQVCLLFLAALRSTYHQYFVDYAKKYGVDFSFEFRYADLSAFSRNFSWMCEQTGVKFSTDDDGDYTLLGIDVEDSQRIEWAWNDVVSIITNNDVMDEVALKAIELNPDAKNEYQDIIAAEEKREYDANIKRLGEKFKIA